MRRLMMAQLGFNGESQMRTFIPLGTLATLAAWAAHFALLGLVAPVVRAFGGVL